MLADLIMPVLLLLAPFLNFVRSNDYSVISAEIFQSLLYLSIAGVGAGLILRYSGGKWRGVLIAFLIVLCLDLQIPNIKSVWLIYTFLLALFLAHILRHHITKIVSVMAIAMILTTIVAPDRQATISTVGADGLASDANSKRSPVIHLILDEYMGVAGLPGEMPLSQSVRTSIIDTFVESGFRLYGGAYSQYFNTYNSIGNALNYSSLSLDAAHFDEVREPYILNESRHFDRLAANGYRFRVYQSSFLDYCSDTAIPIVACHTYRSNSIKYVEELSLLTAEKVGLIMRSFGRLSSIRRGAQRLYNYSRTRVPRASRILPFWSSDIASVGPLPTLSILDQIAADVSKSAGSEVFFAHLLLPHSLYLLDETCKIQPRVKHWQTRRINHKPSDQPNTAESRRETYDAYFKQLQCANKMFRQFITELKAQGVYDSATIIVHGDHGSRINRNWPTIANKEKLVRSDYIDGFPTLFAVKAPGIEPGYIEERATLSALLAASSGAPELAPDERGIYFYNGRGEEMTLESMPADWFE